MNLFRLYISFALKNTLRFPKFAFKLLPGLMLTVIFAIWTFVGIFTVTPASTVPIVVEPVLSTPMFFLFTISVLAIYGSFGNKAIVGARAADANMLMPAPITPFQFFVFMNLKTMLAFVGLIFMAIVLYSGQLMSQLVVPALAIPLYFSLVLVLYTQQFLHYISKTTYGVLAKVSKWAFVVFFIGTFATVLLISLSEKRVVLDHLLIVLWPLLGWAIGFMIAAVLNQVAHMLLFAGLLIGGFLIIYQIAKRTPYNFYEEELAYVQKTESAYKRAVSGESITLKSKFVKTNRTFKHFNEKTLLDRAWMKAGKLWWLHPGLIIKVILLGGISFLVTTLDAEMPFMLQVLAILGVFTYLRLFSVGIKNTELTQDIYLHMLPIKPIYKMIYPLIIPILRAGIISSSITIVVILFGKFEVWSMLNVLLVSGLVFSVELFDIFRCYNLQSLVFERYLGNLLRQLLELVILVVTSAIIGIPIFFMQAATPSLMLAILNMTLLNGVVLFLSVRAYDRVEKGKKDELTF